jgi:hypothetical protein
MLNYQRVDITIVFIGLINKHNYITGGLTLYVNIIYILVD